METDLFTLDENGQIVYESVDGEEVQTEESLFGDNESEVEESGNDVVEDAVTGDTVTDSVETEEDSEEAQEVVVLNADGGSVSVVLSDELTTALIDATTPASGSLGTTTLNYFDRLVGGLPQDAVYVAYRTSSGNSYDGVLLWATDYDMLDGVLTLGNDARQVHVNRVTSGNTSVTEYSEYSAEDVVVNLSKSGDVVYYSNADVGYPVLGGYNQPIGFAPFLVSALICAMATVVLNKLLNRK